MEVLFALPIILIPFFWPVVTGLVARGYGRKFWTWFFLGIPLPFIAVIILLFLPDKLVRNAAAELQPVENEKIFDHLFLEEKEYKIGDPGTPLSARA